MRRLIVAALVLALAGPATAQDQTLADIRQELAVLMVELQRLRGELVTTGGPGGLPAAQTTLERVDAFEAALTRLNARTEAIQNRIDRVVADGTNRIGDLEFRVCEIQPGCDLGATGSTLPLGGEAGVPAPPVPPVAGGGAQLAVGEQADFDAARSAFDGGEWQRAAQLFATFAETYTGGPLTADAHYHRGQALERLGDTTAAARAYLESFSGAPTGSRAPEALLRLGLSLDALGQRQEACVTLGEVTSRFPGNPASIEAQAASASIGCG